MVLEGCEAAIRAGAGLARILDFYSSSAFHNRSLENYSKHIIAFKFISRAMPGGSANIWCT